MKITLYHQFKNQPVNCSKLKLFINDLTCKLERIGALSLSQVKWTGMSPDVTLQLTCARLPSCKFAEKENGSISGGSVKGAKFC